MSLLRDRAIAVNVESTRRDRRPADARAWFVRLTSCRSDDELNVLADQASVAEGSDSTPIEVAAKARTTSIARRRGSRRTSSIGRGAGVERAGTASIDWVVSCARRSGNAGTHRPYGPRPRTSAGRWSCARRARVPRAPPHRHGPCRTARDPPGPHRTGQDEAAVRRPDPPWIGRGQPPIVEANAAYVGAIGPASVSAPAPSSPSPNWRASGVFTPLPDRIATTSSPSRI